MQLKYKIHIFICKLFNNSIISNFNKETNHIYYILQGPK